MSILFWQQGDQLLKVATIPGTAKPVETNAIQESQVTGHKHALHGAARVLKEGDTLYVRAVEPFELRHEEHKTLTIPAGDYRVETVQEFDHFEEESRNVAD